MSTTRFSNRKRATIALLLFGVSFGYVEAAAASYLGAVWEPRRESWCNERLRMKDVYRVRAPIRYGRLSEKRGNTYTMVFSRGCEPGAALAVRC